MIKSNEISNPRSCLSKAADDEPVFVLRSTDRSSPALIRMWAHSAEQTGCAPAKVAEARALADAMERWAIEHGGSKTPD